LLNFFLFIKTLTPNIKTWAAMGLNLYDYGMICWWEMKALAPDKKDKLNCCTASTL
jgi:hypothetical protein